MRPSRRALLAAGLAAVAAAGTVGFIRTRRLQGADAARRIDIRSEPIRRFSRDGADARRFGELVFRSGLVLTSPAEGFGGLSGLWREPDGGRTLVAVTDHGLWLKASVEADGPVLAGLTAAALAPLLDPDGSPLRRGGAYDAEGLAIADGTAFVSFERVHEVRRFAWGRLGVEAGGERLDAPPELRDLPGNGSLEAVAVAPTGHPLAGAVLAIAEQARSGRDTPTRGWVLTGPDRFGFSVARSDDFDVTDAAFLPSGELLLLERHFSLARGILCRIRRVPADAIRRNATLDGPVIFAADGAVHHVDNMEGLSLHRDRTTGDLIVTLVSDDNFSARQRTLMLEFALPS